MPPCRLTPRDIIDDLGISPETLTPDTERLGRGLCARVHAHPRDPGLVLRISMPLDGWIGHALEMEGLPHAPRVSALAFFGGAWIAVSERLSPVGPEGERIIDGMLAAIEGRRDAAFDREFPGLADHAQARLSTADDLRVANLMRRGAEVVVNDPVTLMGAEAFALIDRYEVVMTPEVPADDPEEASP